MKKVLLICFCLVFLVCPCKGQEGSTGFDIIMSRIAADIMEHPADSVINDIIAEMTIEGIWPDVDYQSTSPYNWSPKYHIYRLFTMSSVYIDEHSRYYQDPVIYSKIIKGLYKWKELKPVCSNWFVKAIQEPLKVGGILVLLESVSANLPEDLKDYLLHLLHDSTKTPYDYTDFNRTSVAEHWIYRACVEKDTETLEIAVNCIFDLQKINTGGNGYQLDGAFFHGGPQFYIGGYCSGAIETVINTGVWVRGSEYELSSEHLSVLRNFLTNVYPSCVRGLVINYDCVGRAITERNYLDATSMTISFERMKILDPDNESLYSHTLKWLQLDVSNIESTHNHYWIGDYTTHTRPLYSCSVGLCSTRTMKPEYGHSGNLYGYFLSDGNTCFMTTGNEYYNIAPLWDWNYIPGTTAPLLEEIPLQKTAFGCYGTSEFAGGVTDLLYGATGYMYYDDYKGINTGANKGYFFFDNEVVCLGSNVKSDHQVVTTVEQCWGSDELDVQYKTNAGFNHLVGDVKFENSVSCVIHRGIAYYFPDGSADVSCQNLEREGNWNTLDTSQKDTTIAGRVFQLAIKHEMSDNTANNYAYIIVPEKDVAGMEEYVSNTDVEILTNTDSVQAVRNRNLGIIEMIFYRGCTFKSSQIELTTSKPCAIIYKYDERGNPLVHVADPAQKGEDILVGIRDFNLGKNYSGMISYGEMPKEYWGTTQIAELREDTTVDIQEVINVNRGKPFDLSCDGECYVYDMKGNLIKTIQGRLKLCLEKKGAYIMKTFSGNSSKCFKLFVR